MIIRSLFELGYLVATKIKPFATSLKASKAKMITAALVVGSLLVSYAIWDAKKSEKAPPAPTKVSAKDFSRSVASVEKKNEWTFKYNTKDFKTTTGTDFKDKEFSLVVHADTKEEAFSKASKECFSRLSGGKFQGEDRGLDIIDICVNPR